ncbi:MAG: sigma-54-dependent Fis family transcriptional regulator, partial [Alphaproteobacteria bacterium]|nr:sigma-54-dependent Fis family transcriptional regulator [Alphaproteobacteria bacterium]
MRLLIIGDLYGQIGAASAIARARGAKVVHVQDAAAAMVALRGGQGADLIMVEARQDIEKLITMLMRERFHLPVVACGVQSDKEAAVRAIKAGAKEYLPLPPQEDLIAAVLEAITEESHSVIHASKAMAEVLAMADQVAPSDASILITGESGTGKEVMARYIHRKSRRASHPMISVNCAAIPEHLLESELFGYEKGAFTGAAGRRIGKFEEADGGTMFLDEISEMDLRLQAKLLRVLQEREIDRIGGAKPIKVNIRVIATSNRNLQEEVKTGRFREDLYFRLNVINIQLPPLRERPEDIDLLAKYFIDKYATANGMPVRPLSEKARLKLHSWRWPGNVRELENAMHRAVLLARGEEIDDGAIFLSGRQEAAPAAAPAAASPAPRKAEAGANGTLVGRTVENVERDLILDTLDHCLGNRTHAANILGISIRT